MVGGEVKLERERIRGAFRAALLKKPVSPYPIEGYLADLFVRGRLFDCAALRRTPPKNGRKTKPKAQTRG
jgi:hypothetical protein